MSNRLDGVVGDGRKRMEPNWVTGRERVYRPQPVGCRCALHQRLRDEAKPEVEVEIGRD